VAKKMVGFRRKRISRKVARRKVGGCVGCAVLI
jgi:hypothetical protein